MPKPKPTDDEAKKAQLLKDLDYKERLAQKRKQQAAIKQAELKAAQEELEKAEQEAQDQWLFLPVRRGLFPQRNVNRPREKFLFSNAFDDRLNKYNEEKQSN
jgi:hypothetical protein